MQGFGLHPYPAAKTELDAALALSDGKLSARRALLDNLVPGPRKIPVLFIRESKTL